MKETQGQQHSGGMDRHSSWSDDLSKSKPIITTTTTIAATQQQQHDVAEIIEEIERLGNERHRRLKIIQCMNGALRSVEHLMSSKSSKMMEKHGMMSDSFHGRIKTAISTYEKSIGHGFSLGENVPPKDLQITVRMCDDMGTIITESGQLVLRKDSIVSGLRSDLLHLVHSGHAELLF